MTAGLLRCSYSRPTSHQVGEMLPAENFTRGQYACRKCKNENLREARARKAGKSPEATRANGEPPKPIVDEDTAPGVPPPRLDDPGKPDIEAYAQKPGGQRFRLLFIDIETSPLLAYTWGTFKQDISVDQIIKPTSVLCFAAQWYGSSEVIYYEARTRPSLDFNLMIRAAHGLLSECHAVAHYNGQRFDIPRLNREFLQLGLPPTPPLHQIDLWKTITKFNMDSSKLAFVGPALGIGEKIKNDGWKLWGGCMDGDAPSWEKMQAYCKGDVTQLPALYEKVLPWIDGHPNLNLLVTDDGKVCPNCGGELAGNGVHRATTYVYKQYVCKQCGRTCRDRTRSKSEPVAPVR